MGLRCGQYTQRRCAQMSTEMSQGRERSSSVDALDTPRKRANVSSRPSADAMPSSETSALTPFGWKDPLDELQPLFALFRTPRALPCVTIAFATATLVSSVCVFYASDHNLEAVCQEFASAADCDGVYIPSIASVGVSKPEYWVMAIGISCTGLAGMITNVYLFLALKDRIRTFRHDFNNMYSQQQCCCTCLSSMCSPLCCAYPAPHLHACNGMQFLCGLLVFLQLFYIGFWDMSKGEGRYLSSMAAFVGLHVLQNILLLRMQVTLNIHPDVDTAPGEVFEKTYEFRDLPIRTRLKAVTGLVSFSVLAVCLASYWLDGGVGFYGYVLPICQWIGYISLCCSIGSYFFDFYRSSISWSGKSALMRHNFTSEQRLRQVISTAKIGSTRSSDIPPGAHKIIDRDDIGSVPNSPVSHKSRSLSRGDSVHPGQGRLSPTA